MNARGTKLIGIVALILACASLTGQDIVPSRSPGVYDRSILLAMEVPDDRAAYYTFDADEDALLIPYEYPLLLSALSGEERNYTLKIFLRDGDEYAAAGELNYRIDKRAPAPPRADLASGYHTGEQRVGFGRTQDTIYFSLDGDISGDPQIWNGESLRLAPREAPYLLYAYSRDPAGNISDLRSWEYTVGSPGVDDEPRVSVLSPAPGRFVNPQLLFIDSRGAERILYSLDGSDPRIGGIEYTEPVLIEPEGDYQLSVVGDDGEGGFSAPVNIRFSVDGGEAPPSLPPAGVYSGAVRLPFGSLKAHYTFEERMPSVTDLTADDEVTLFATPRGVATYALRFRPVADGKLAAGQYRIFYRIDSRIPAEPIISVSGRSPHAEPPQISISAPDYAEIRYTLNGSSPTAESTLYGGPFMPDFDGGTGNLMIRAAAFGVNGRRGEEAASLITYDLEAPSSPVLERLEQDTARRLQFRVENGDDALPVYEISFNPDVPPADPTADSPPWTGEPVELPWGMRRQVQVAVALRDGAGNLSQTVRIEGVIDRLPPPPPRIAEADSGISITGEGRLYVAVSTVGGNDGSDPSFTAYTEPIELAGVRNRSVQYRIEAYAEDEWGNRSELTVRQRTVDNRLPEVPFLSGIEDRRVYNDAVLTVDYNPPQEDYALLYTLATGDEEPPRPDTASAELKGRRIETPPGEEVYYHLKVLPVFPQRGRTGRVSSYRFIVDRRAPDLPQPLGLPPNGVSRDPVKLEFSAVGEGDEIYYQLVEDNEDADIDPIRYGRRYTAPVEIDSEAGSETNVRIFFAAVDRAGNRSDAPAPLTLTVDRKPPVLPTIAGVPETGVSPVPLELRFDGEPATKIEYRIFREAELSRAKEIPFSPYSDPITVSGIAGELVLLNLEYRSVDPAGNLSARTARRILAVDRRNIAQPTEPTVDYRADENFVMISWPSEATRGSGRIFYRIGGNGSEYRPYAAPVSVALDGGTASISYYLQTESGLQSAVHTREFEQISGGESSLLFQGVADGGVYGGEVVIDPVLRTGGGLLRYETASANESLRLSPYSPILSEPLRFNVPRGSERTFRVSVGRFATRDAQLPQASETVEFTIDRSPPPPPLMRELVNPDGDSPYKLIELDGRGNGVEYKLSFVDGSTRSGSYTDILKLDTRGKAGETVAIEAISIDGVGNRSLPERWEVLLDQDIIYLAETGNDLYEGTRLRPFRSLEKAVAVARRLNKQTIYMGAGRYPVQRPLLLDWDVNLVGGLDPSSWNPAGQSLIETGAYFPRDGRVLTVGRRHRLERLRIVDSGKGLRTPLLLSEAAVRLDDVDCFPGSAWELLLEQRGGTLSATDTDFTGGVDGLLLSEGGTVTFDGVTVRPGAGGARKPVITVRRGSLFLNGGTVVPSDGDTTVAIELENGYAVLRETEIHTGSGSRRATALKISGGELSIADSRLVADGTGVATVLIEADGAAIEAADTAIELAARNGAIGFLLRDGSFEGRYLDIRSRGNPGYLFMLQQHGGAVELNNVTASLSARGEPILFDLDGGRLNLLHSTLLVSSRSGRPLGVASRGGAQLYLTNSILSARGGPAGTALSGENRDTWSVINSNLGGWRRLAEYGGTVISTAEELNLFDADPFGGWLNGVIAEAPEATFADDLYRLREDSLCVDAGAETGTELPDIDGEERPNPGHGIRPFPDIGADEFYAAR